MKKTNKNMNYVLDSKLNSMIGIDNENKISLYSNEYPNIDYMYIAKEDGELDYYGQKFDVEAGDVILKLYSRGKDYSQREIVIIPAAYAKQWVSNIIERKERKQSDACETPCCDSPSPAENPA